MNRVAWTNVLELSKSAGGYYFHYFDKNNPAAHGFFTPFEISPGSDFPGYPQLRSAVLVARLYLGAAVLVVGLGEGN